MGERRQRLRKRIEVHGRDSIAMAFLEAWKQVDLLLSQEYGVGREDHGHEQLMIESVLAVRRSESPCGHYTSELVFTFLFETDFLVDVDT